jgi:exodeoxyribonuclease-3
MKIISWNVNGLRAMMKKQNLIDLINEENPDIFCLGETKLNEELDIFTDYNSYWSHCQVKNGYSGTVIFTKKKPKNIIYGLNVDNIEHDLEGRVITCEFSKFILIHVYTPNSGELLKRLDYRINTWDIAFTKYLNILQSKKNVILCGDLNVAHHEIDLKNPKTNLKTAGFTVEERQSFDLLLNKTDMIDSFRYLHPETIKYSYWGYKFNCRKRNCGWRIDYFLLSKKLIKKIIKSDILDDILGSDHAPIILELK